MFADERDLTVRSGSGGNGLVAWRREKFVPHGGPGGGDGGRGGDVVLVADPQLTTFSDMEQVRRLRGEDGGRGMPDRKTGKNGADRELRVPVGTTVYDATTGERLADLTEPDQRFVAGRGGRGGRGNVRFATALNQRPDHAEPGEPGEERHLRLELRLLADVGIVGLPNAGKSTFLSKVSAATPRIAAYPFTTLEPGLGIAETDRHERIALADLPGLIEGAHRGRGLGDRFLRHVERTRVLLHLVDLAPEDGSDPAAAYLAVRRELEAYGRGLAERPEVLAGTKIDRLSAEEREAALRRLAEAADRDVHPLSAVSGEGVAGLLRAVAEAVRDSAPPPDVPDRVAVTPPLEPPPEATPGP
jgi:GTP-binding protein